MMSKHTPLPWTAGRSESCSTPFMHISAADRDIGYLTLNPQEVEANAAFIVTACNSHYDLVDALKDVRALARKMMIAGGTDAEFADIRLEKATAALAKAGA